MLRVGFLFLIGVGGASLLVNAHLSDGHSHTVGVDLCQNVTCIPDDCQVGPGLCFRGNCTFGQRADGARCRETDGNPCTNPGCSSGLCVQDYSLAADSTACDDGNPLTDLDQCVDGMCTVGFFFFL